MPEEAETELEAQTGTPTGGVETNHTLTLLAQKVLGTDNTPPMTSEQMDKLIDQRGKIIDYVHKDKKRDSFDAKFYLIAVLVFIVIFAGLVMWKLPEYFGEVLSFLAGL